MPAEWQGEFVRMLDELDEKVRDLPDYVGEFWVRAVDEHGKFVHDEYRDYQRGRRRVFED